ncbi:MAG: PKD domain-containing protein, partial [Bacteroidales bacterium]
MPNTVCTPATISLANHSQTIGSQTSFYWDFGDGTNSTEISPVHTYSEGGLYDVMLIVSDMGSCNFADTLIKTLLVLTNSTDTLATKNMCNGDFVQIGIPPSGNPDITYNWTPNLFLSNSDISNPIAYPDTTTIYTLIVGNQFCSDTLLQKIEVSYLSIASLSDTTICLGDSAVLSIVSSEGTIQSVIWSTDPSFNTIINTDLLQTVLTISPSVTTTYYVKIRGAQCIITGQATVYVSSVEITETPSFTICFEENITISIGVNAPEGCTYQWAPEVWIVSGSQSATPVINPPGNATYTVTITNPFGCRASGEVQVQKRTSSFPSELEVWSSKNRILAGDQLTLYATDYQDIEYHYQWAPPTDLSAPYSPVTQASP